MIKLSIHKEAPRTEYNMIETKTLRWSIIKIARLGKRTRMLGKENSCATKKTKETCIKKRELILELLITIKKNRKKMESIQEDQTIGPSSSMLLYPDHLRDTPST